jgi:hypothetical protein
MPRLAPLALVLLPLLAVGQQPDLSAPINIVPKPVSSDASVKLDYDIVYVRAPRKGDAVGTNWPEISNPVFMDAGADLMLLRPDGSEEVLVKGGEGSVTDPMVSFDGEWVYYSRFHDMKNASVVQGPTGGADIFKIHVKSRKTVRLTHQQFTPNTGAGNWSDDFRTPEPGKNSLGYGVFNMGPCPLPGGKIVFASNRNGFKPPKRVPHVLQLFTMDEDGSNVECIGHLNLGMALHPVVLRDGRIMFSSLESQGLRSSTLWGLWTIHPDGTNWGPMASAFAAGANPSAWHFQTQMGDGSIVAEEYYNQTSSGFGGFVRFPASPPNGEPAFGPGFKDDPRNPPLRHGRFDTATARVRRLPFSPFGIESITRFARTDEGPADFATRSTTPTRPGVRPPAREAPRVGKVTHPSAAPDNHLLAVWSPGPVNGGYTVHQPAVDGGLYLIKEGKAIDEPGQMLLIKNDPKFNEQWPRALVPYKRVHGMDEPKKLPRLANDGTLSKHLPAGTPFGLVGTSSFFKRESYPNGVVKPGSVTATFAGKDGGYEDLDPFNTTLDATSMNWFNQGADAGRYSNDDIHAVRILAMEPTTDRTTGPGSGRTFRSHANERLRVLGEVPLRKPGDPKDPDGNPDTSFLAKIPADVGFTFQTLDKRGMVLNMAQTWHQVRPGEVRVDCGGCHAHSQKPTDFKLTAAAKPDYAVADLTKGVKDVEYFRDIKPILDRSCAACHTGDKPAGNLVLDDNKTVKLPDADDVPGTYYRLAMDYAGRFGHKPVIGSWRNHNASRYIRMFQSRRSLLTWKVYGARLDGWANDDFPTETTHGDARTLSLKGEAVANTPANRNRADLDFTGSAMPPPDAVKAGKVKPLTEEDKRTLTRWIDLGCPIDLDPKYGWHLDDQRPTLAVAVTPTAVRVGMHDYGTGLEPESFAAVHDGKPLTDQFKAVGDGVWELPLAKPLTGTLHVRVKDKQGNVTRVAKTIGGTR